MPERDAEFELQHLYALFYGDLGICGCNMPWEAYNVVRDLLAYCAQDHADRDCHDLNRIIGTDGAVHLVLCLLDNAKLIEHGSTVAGAWLTDKGRCALEWMRRHEWEDREDGTPRVDETGYPHDGGDCTAACWVPSEPSKPQSTTGELLERVRVETEQARAAMSPLQRIAYDQYTAMVESIALFGSPEPPILPEPRPLSRGAGIDIEAEAAKSIRARLNPAGNGWVQALLDEAATLGNSPLENAAKQMADLLREQEQRGSLFHDKLEWDDPADRLPRGGRNVYIGCRKIDGTYIHGDPHDCPKWARG
jgi:hypothetical protein